MKTFNLRLLYFLVVVFMVVGLLGCGSSQQSNMETKNPSITVDDKNVEAEKQITQKDIEMEALKKASEEATKDLNEYLEGFRVAEVSWLNDTDNFEVKLGKGQNVVEVKTALYPDAEGKQAAEDKLAGVWGWANSNSEKLYIDYIKVFDQNGEVLLTKRNHTRK